MFAHPGSDWVNHIYRWESLHTDWNPIQYLGDNRQMALAILCMTTAGSTRYPTRRPNQARWRSKAKIAIVNKRRRRIKSDCSPADAFSSPRRTKPLPRLSGRLKTNLVRFCPNAEFPGQHKRRLQGTAKTKVAKGDLSVHLRPPEQDFEVNS